MEFGTVQQLLCLVCSTICCTTPICGMPMDALCRFCQRSQISLEIAPWKVAFPNMTVVGQGEALTFPIILLLSIFGISCNTWDNLLLVHFLFIFHFKSDCTIYISWEKDNKLKDQTLVFRSRSMYQLCVENFESEEVEKKMYQKYVFKILIQDK